MVITYHFRSWHGWEIDTNTYEMIIPDQSRVYRRPFEGLSSQADYMTELFNRERSTKLYVPITDT